MDLNKATLLKFLFPIILLIGIIFHSNAQINYVPNPSFEDISDCNLNAGQANKATPWIIDNFPVSTPDLYNTCSTTGLFDTPESQGCNLVYPKTGNGMVGLAHMVVDENIYAWLTDELPRGVDIYIAYSIIPRAPCNVGNYEILCYANTMTLALADAQFERDIIFELDEILDFSDDWTLMQTCYQASGDEEIIMLGNYKPVADLETDCSFNDPLGNNFSYYYVDDVIVSPFDVVPDTLFICGNEVLNVDATFYDVPISWSDGLQGSQRRIDQAGRYTVLGDVGDCFLTDETVVIQIPDDRAEEKVKFCEDGEVLLESPTPAIWPNGDTSQSYLVTRPGIYRANLLSTCGERIVEYIVEETDCNIEYFIPNVFSPNDDGINDRVEFFFRSEFEFTGELYIFDRWGKRIYTAKNVNPAYWDGTYQGEPLNPAVFVWAYRYTSAKDGRTRVVSGDITLVR